MLFPRAPVRIKLPCHACMHTNLETYQPIRQYKRVNELAVLKLNRNT